MKNTGMKRLGLRSGLVFAAAGVLVVGCGAGAFAAAAPALLAPHGLTAASGQKTVPMGSPHYKTNAKGLTYGSSKQSDSPAHEPDLIGVVTTNNLTKTQVSRMAVSAVAASDTGGGEAGYVYKSDLAAADGSNIANPTEAAAWMAKGAKEDHTVPVYDNDGVTQIGTFVVYGSDSTGTAAATTATGK